MEIDRIAQRFDEAANKYDSQRRFFIPCFDDFYKTSISIFSKMRSDFKSILDLGAGTGLLTRYLHEIFPQAHFTLVDISEGMLDIARSRFCGFDQFDFLISDYSSELPIGKFDLAASALSIHHLSNEDKLKLYRKIHDSLNENGYLLNLDQFNASSNLVNSTFNKWWYEHIRKSGISCEESAEWLKRRELDRENTISQTLDLLRVAGFKTVDCIYQYMKFAVIIAVR
jgi:tRNA (cmo5U34)-methyltransferase